jgi:Flp pilus assembly protein TadD
MGALAAVAVALSMTGCAAGRPASVAADEPRFSSPEEKLLFEAHRDVVQHRSTDAIRTLDRILHSFGDPETKTDGPKPYCARSMEETLHYLMLAQAEGRDALVLEPTWAEAYYLKGYALVELGQLEEARRAISRALVLSPKNSKYLSEIAHIFQLERNWTKALEQFSNAEGASRHSPAETRIEEKTRALRGQGYALVELGRLAEAEAKYRASLAADRNDFRSEQELGYVESLRKREGN